VRRPHQAKGNAGEVSSDGVFLVEIWADRSGAAARKYLFLLVVLALSLSRQGQAPPAKPRGGEASIEVSS